MGKAGKALRQVLEAYSISQNKLAVTMGIGRSTMHYWFNDIRKGLRKINPEAAQEFIRLYLDESDEDGGQS
jgi:transcriptional regulator with XRE-family HTH domain